MTEVAAAAPLRVGASRARDLIVGEPELLGQEVGVELRRGPVIRQQVTVELGGPEPVTSGTRWSLDWTPVGHTTTLPAFEGILEVLDDDDGSSVVRVRGSYRPPLGVVGVIVDTVIGHRVAEASVEDFVATVARRVDRAAVQQPAGWREPERPADLRPG